MYNEALDTGHLPTSLLEASISLLLKSNKDPLECGSYRRISHLNLDLKILAKVLATRLQGVLSRLVSQDQTGFMLGRLSFHNTRRLFNILVTPDLQIPEVVVSLDAGKHSTE